MYVPLVAALLEQRLPVTYLSHVTGHGLLKLMRPQRELTYRIERLPPVPPVLEFLVEQAGLEASQAYTTFNMGSGFAVYCAAGAGEQVVAAAALIGLEALVAGVVEEGPRRVVVEPAGLSFEGAEMELSAPQQQPSG
jgi:phosphoribosylformylglycinamidine cyclo-ligase